MKHLEIKNVVKEVNEKTLFNINDIIINKFEKIGIVGKNGSGKSTLLKMIVEEDKNYTGFIGRDGKIKYIPQLKENTTESGGEQVKNYLIEAFNENADILMLDEPTSNLDQENIKWLINQIRKYSYTLIVVSHDRQVLELMDKLIYFKDTKVEIFAGNYSDFEDFQENQFVKQQLMYKEYHRTVNRLNNEVKNRNQHAASFKKRKKNISISDYKVNSRMGSYDGQEKAIAKSSKALEKRIEKLEAVEKPKEENPFKFKKIGAVKDEGKTLINLEPDEVFINDRKLFSFSHFKLTQGEHISLIGANKTGKTTFIKQLIDRKFKGYYVPDMKVGYFAQNFSQLNFKKSILENVMEDTLQDVYLVRNLLGSLGFNIDKINKNPEILSGGERVRLSLAKVLVGNYHLLILDEPTNYLDIDTLKSIEKFLINYPGTFILISHDDIFVKNTTKHNYEIKNRQLLDEVYQHQYQSKDDNQRQLLEFKITQLMADPEVDIKEILILKERLKNL